MIVIIGAMTEEVDALLQRMVQYERHENYDIVYYTGRLSGRDIVVAQSGIGKVNAAFTTAFLIAQFHPELVINIGSAGGLQPQQKVGDLVIASHLQYHDFDIGDNTHLDPRFIFEVNKNLIDRAARLLQHEDIPYHIGLIISGDQFISKTNPAFARIHALFPQAICVEMEATAVGAVCSKTQTPFIILRSLSDIATEADNDLTFELYIQLASVRSAKLCEMFIQDLN